MRLSIEKLHIGDRAASDPFVDIGRILVRVSWSSLFRLAPVVGEVAVDHPAFHIVRTAEQRFNFSDLLESSGPTPAPTPTPSAPAKPQRFAVSNIQIHEGEVHFDDKVLNEQHALEHLELDVPFIANLPADVNIFVQPLLQMVIDGSLVRIAGKAKPFAVPPESVINLNLHHFGLPLYVGYVPVKLPVKIPQGTLSSQLQVHFVNAASAPEIRVGGEVALDQIDVRDTANAPVAGFKHMSMVLTELKPLENVTHLGKIYLDGLTVHVVRNPDGTINLASLAGSKPAPAAAAAQATPSPAAASLAAAQPSAAPSPAAATTAAAAVTPAATPTPAANTAQLTANAPPAAASTPQPAAATAKPPAPADVSLEELALTNGAVEITDNSVAPPATLALRNLRVGLKDLRTVDQKAPAPYELGTTLGGGGYDRGQGRARPRAFAGDDRRHARRDRHPGAARIRAVGSGSHRRVRQADRARQRPDPLRHRQIQRACGAGEHLVRQVRVARSARERKSDRMEQAERVDRAGRSCDAPGDGHRSALRRTASCSSGASATAS